MNKPTNPNITIPESFAVNGIKADFDNNKILNGFDRIQPDVLAGDNLNKFIDDTYKGLNYSIAGTDAINLIQEDEVLSVENGQLVSKNFSDKFVDLTNTQIISAEKTIKISSSSDTNPIFTCIQKNASDYGARTYSNITIADDNAKPIAIIGGLQTPSNNGGVRFLGWNETGNAYKTLLSLQGNKDYSLVNEYYVNSNSWYCIFDNGFKMMGGVYQNGTFVNFIKNFSNANYGVFATCISGDAASPYSTELPHNRVSNGFSIKNTSGRYYCWCAFGF